MFSLLMRTYGMGKEWVLSLTVPEFNARLQDVGEIHNMMQGEGKGRIAREPMSTMVERLRAKGIDVPDDLRPVRRYRGKR